MQIIKKNVPLADKTSFKIGGAARFYACPETETEARKAITWARKNDNPVFILGGGSNILVSDSGWDGLVIDISGFSEIRQNKNYFECRSGTLLYDLVTTVSEEGLCGIEELAGIPGTIGGGTIMNAGAFSQNISDCLQWVSGVNVKSGITWKRERDEIDFGYRQSSLKNHDNLILKASFLFQECEGKDPYAISKNTIAKRNDKQPLNHPNCGSVFKRPENGYAGTLIEKAGLKGLRVGGVMVSTKHANFFQNVSGATAENVRELIASVQKRVYTDSGVLLESELVFAGEFKTPLFKPK